MKGLTTNKYGVYKFRLRISSNAKSYFSKNELNKSLDTKELHIALSKATLLYNEYLNILKVIKMDILSQEQIQDLVDKFITDTLNQDKIDRVQSGYGLGYAPANNLQNDIEASREVISEFLAGYKEQLAHSDFSDVTNTARSLLEPLGVTLNSTEQSHQLFMQHLLRGHIEVFTEAYNRYKGSYNKQYDSINTPTKIKPQQPTIITNSRALEVFLKSYKVTTSETQYRDVSNFLNDIFIHIVHEDEAINSTTLEDLLEIREVLSNLPKRNIQKYREMSIEQLLESNPTEDEVIASRTLNKQVKWLKMFYTFCMDNNYIDKNPIISLTSTSRNDVLSERLPLTNDEIKKLLTVTKADEVFHNGIKALAYSGMRLSEMYKAKITLIDDVSCFDLTDRAIKLKTRSSYRIIPIHSDINIAMIQQLPSQGNFSRKVNNIIREQISDDDKKVLYSLRHSFATTLKHNNIQPEVISELMGHSHQTMTLNRYANRYEVNTLKEAIDSLSH